MTRTDAALEPARASRPGGRSARVRAAVLAATLEVLRERGFDGTQLPEVARRAGVHPTTVYRRWGSKARLIGEALIERGRPLSPTPDTGALRTDLERLLIEGGALLGTPPVRAMFEVLMSDPEVQSAEVARARDRFVEVHLEEARTVITRAVMRSELPEDTDPSVLIELVIGPALLRALLLGLEVGPTDAAQIVDRALAALGANDVPERVDG